MDTKYKINDKITFNLEGKTITATIRWIDYNGTFENPNEVCYDVIGEIDGVDTIIKHIPHSLILT